MSNGEVLRVRAALKPISTVPRALATIDTETGEATTAIHQRSDTSAVVPAAVIAEAMVALTLAEALLDKTGGDSVAEVRRNLAGYLSNRAEHLHEPPIRRIRRPSRVGKVDDGEAYCRNHWH